MNDFVNKSFPDYIDEMVNNGNLSTIVEILEPNNKFGIKLTNEEKSIIIMAYDVPLEVKIEALKLNNKYEIELDSSIKYIIIMDYDVPLEVKIEALRQNNKFGIELELWEICNLIKSMDSPIEKATEILKLNNKFGIELTNEEKSFILGIFELPSEVKIAALKPNNNYGIKLADWQICNMIIDGKLPLEIIIESLKPNNSFNFELTDNQKLDIIMSSVLPLEVKIEALKVNNVLGVELTEDQKQNIIMSNVSPLEVKMEALKPNNKYGVNLSFHQSRQIIIGMDSLSSVIETVTGKEIIDNYNPKLLRQLLIYKYKKEWDLYRMATRENRDMYIGLSRKITTSLTNETLEQVMSVFSKQILAITTTLGKTENEISNIFAMYQVSGQANSIIDLIREFNAKSESKYIEQQTAKELMAIKEKCSVDKEKVRLKIKSIKQKDSFELTISQEKELENLVAQSGFNPVNIKELTSLILEGNNKKINELLGIVVPLKYEEVVKIKALKRLRQNYQVPFRTEIMADFSKYLNKEEEKSYLEEKMSKEERNRLNDIMSLVKEANASIVIDGSKGISYNVSYKMLTQDEMKNIEEYESKQASLKRIRTFIGKALSNQEKDIRITDEDLNYYIDNKLVDIDDCLTLPQISSDYTLNDSIINILKTKYNDVEKKNLDCLFTQGIIPSLVYLKYFNEASLLIDSIKFLSKKGTNIEPDNLNKLLLISGLYGYVTDDTQIPILGGNVIEKIVSQYGGQYTDGNTFVVKRERLTKIFNYLIKSYDSKYRHKTVPSIELKDEKSGILLKTYKNIDPRIYLTGINTGACFRIDGYDNDFLLYDIFNKNGVIVEFLNPNGDFLGRVSGFRNGNTVYFNQIRTAMDISDTKKTLESETTLVTINKIFRQYGQELIAKTINDNVPIEHIYVTEGYGFRPMPNDSVIKYDIKNSYPMQTKTSDYDEFLLDKELKKIGASQLGFTTDYQTGARIFLIASSSNRSINPDVDIKKVDVEATYDRPRDEIKTAVDADLPLCVEHINRINALNCYMSDDKEKNLERRYQYRELKTLDNIVFIAYGEDWYLMLDDDGNKYSCILPKDERAQKEYDGFLQTDRWLKIIEEHKIGKSK